FLVPKGQTIVDEVKMYAFVIKRLLDCLVCLAGNDRTMVRGVERFLMEAQFNLGRFVEGAAANLPRLTREFPHPLQVEAPDVEADTLESRGAERADDGAPKSALSGRPRNRQAALAGDVSR